MTNNSNLSRRGVTRRILVMTCAIIVIFAFMCGRLAYLQLFNYEDLRSNALNQYSSTMILPASRGSITDRNGKIIAMSETVETVFISPAGILKAMQREDNKTDYKALISENLSTLLDVDRSEILTRMEKTKSQYEVIKRNVSGEVAEKVREFIIDNELYTMVNMEEASKRYYPYGTLAAHLIGFNGTDGGLMGLERYYEDELAGIDGRIVKAKNGTGSDLTFKYETHIEAQNGSNIVTTIDVNIQSILEKYLEKAYNDHKPENRVAGIIMNVDTGEIYASGVYPDFDLNSPYTLAPQYQEKLNNYIAGVPDDSKADTSKSDDSETSEETVVGPVTEEDVKKKTNELLNEMWNNKVANDTYEPGSTFKVVTSAIALEDGVGSIGDTYYCDGEYTIHGMTIHCHKDGGHGSQTFAQFLQNSCNPAFVDLGLEIGQERFIKYFEEFGFLELTGSDILGERKTYYYGTNGSPFTEIELATYSFGQSFRTTMLQELRAVSAVANGGYLVTPHVAKSLTDDNGNVTYTFDYSSNKKQIISKTNADVIVKMLADGINVGSTKNAAVAGYTIAAKTGTSQKLEREEDVYVSSCVAFAPAEDPQIAIIIAVDEPTSGEFYGGLVAAPVVSNVLSEVLPYLEIPMNGEAEHPTINITKYVDKSVDDAKKLVQESGLEYKIIGEGSTVVQQIPAPGSSVTDSGTVYLFTEYETEHEKTKVPEVVGNSEKYALKHLREAGLNVRVMGAYSSEISGIPMVTAISIEEGTEVDKGTLITVEFRYYDGVDG